MGLMGSLWSREMMFSEDHTDWVEGGGHNGGREETGEEDFGAVYARHKGDS